MDNLRRIEATHSGVIRRMAVASTWHQRNVIIGGSHRAIFYLVTLKMLGAVVILIRFSVWIFPQFLKITRCPAANAYFYMILNRLIVNL